MKQIIAIVLMFAANLASAQTNWSSWTKVGEFQTDTAYGVDLPDGWTCVVVDQKVKDDAPKPYVDRIVLQTTPPKVELYDSEHNVYSFTITNNQVDRMQKKKSYDTFADHCGLAAQSLPADLRNRLKTYLDNRK